MQVEWDRLRAKKVWDETTVREWDDVAAEARAAGTDARANLGYLFGICVEKNSEQPKGHPSRKYKGRVVFQGNRVFDQQTGVQACEGLIRPSRQRHVLGAALRPNG